MSRGEKPANDIRTEHLPWKHDTFETGDNVTKWGVPQGVDVLEDRLGIQ